MNSTGSRHVPLTASSGAPKQHAVIACTAGTPPHSSANTIRLLLRCILTPHTALS
jgi:hypothetical protein